MKRRLGVAKLGTLMKQAQAAHSVTEEADGAVDDQLDSVRARIRKIPITERLSQTELLLHASILEAGDDYERFARELRGWKSHFGHYHGQFALIRDMGVMWIRGVPPHEGGNFNYRVDVLGVLDKPALEVRKPVIEDHHHFLALRFKDEAYIVQNAGNGRHFIDDFQTREPVPLDDFQKEAINAGLVQLVHHPPMYHTYQSPTFRDDLDCPDIYWHIQMEHIKKAERDGDIVTVDKPGAYHPPRMEIFLGNQAVQAQLDKRLRLSQHPTAESLYDRIQRARTPFPIARDD